MKKLFICIITACALWGCGNDTDETGRESGPTINDLLDKINQKYEDTFYGYEVAPRNGTSGKEEARFELPEIRKRTVDKKPRIFRMAVILSYSKNKDLNEELSARRGQIIKLVETLLENRHENEIDSKKGIQRIENEIKAHVNLILKKGSVEAVIIKKLKT